MHSWFDRSSEQPLAPAMLVGLIVTLAGAAIALNQVSPWFSPVLVLVSLGGLVFVALRQTSAGLHNPSRAREENFSKLGTIDFAQTEQWLKANVRGQDEAIEIVISSLRSQVAIAQPGQLLGSFLLVGPTGTGKTFLPQLLARALYPNSEPMFRRCSARHRACQDTKWEVLLPDRSWLTRNGSSFWMNWRKPTLICTIACLTSSTPPSAARKAAGKKWTSASVSSLGLVTPA
jgi:hypothetical protein